MDLKQIEAAALALSSVQRGAIAKRLLWSLEDAGETSVSPDLDSAWAELAERRYHAFLDGHVRAVPADEALARLRRSATPVHSSELDAALLALPPDERGHLADRLLESLEDDSDLGDPEVVERAWIDEVRRREQRFRAGETREVPAAEALARVRAGLRRA